MASEELDSEVDELDQIIAAYLEAIDRGEFPDREQLKLGHPQWSEELQSFFDDLDQVRKPTLGKPAAGHRPTGVTKPCVIGNYRLVQPIGEGGMGEVWMAMQERPVRRRVALKLIRRGLDSELIVARFESERQALAMMNHPNIAKVLDGGTADDGRPYFVMELVEGVAITKYCDQNQLSIEERLKLFVPVCNAVQHAHQKGIIHRDLKPTNILVALYDGLPVPKVIDFGLAKALQREARLSDQTLSTRFGEIVGTLLYMSPEQAELNGLNVDTRTDIYALGVLLYELLTGSTPIDRKGHEQLALLRRLELLREHDPPRPSARLSSSRDRIDDIGQRRQIEPGKLMQILKGDLDWIVMKAIEKDRARRYETASGFAEDVTRFLKSEPVQARPPSAGYVIKKLVRKHRGAVVAASAISTLLIAGIIITSWLAIVAAIARDQARTAATQLVKQTQRTQAAQRRADQEKLNAQIALARESASSFYSHVERAKGEIGQRRPGWRARAQHEIDQARQFAPEDEDSQSHIRSLVAASLTGLDIAEPKFSFAIEGARVTAFHPSKPWLFIATGRAFFPDRFSHVFVVDWRSGKRLFDLTILDGSDPVGNGVRSLTFVDQGRLLYAGMRSGNVSVFDLDKLPEKKTPRRIIPIESIGPSRTYAVKGSGTVAVVARKTENESRLLTIDAKTDSVVKISDLGVVAYSSVVPERNALIVADATRRPPIVDLSSHDRIDENPLMINADAIAYHSGCLAVREYDRIAMHSLRHSAYIGDFELPPLGLPNPYTSNYLKMSPDGTLLTYADAATKDIHFWSTTDRKHLLSYRAQSSSEATCDLEFSTDGSTISICQGELVTIHEMRPSLVRPRGLFPGLIKSVAVDESSQVMAVLSSCAEMDISNKRSGYLSIEPLAQGHRAAAPADIHVTNIPRVIDALIAIDDSRVGLTQDFNVPNGDSEADPFAGSIGLYDRSSLVGSQLADPVGLFRCNRPNALAFAQHGMLVVTSEFDVYGLAPGSKGPRRSWSSLSDRAYDSSRRFLTITCGEQDHLLLTDREGWVTTLKWADPPELLGQFQCSTGPIRSAVYSATNRRYAVGDDDGQIGLVDYRKGEIVSRTQAHASGVTSLLWLDDRTLISGSMDNSVRIWTLQDDALVLYCEIPFQTGIRRLFGGLTKHTILLHRDGCSAVEELNLAPLLPLPSPAEPRAGAHSGWFGVAR